MIELTDDLGRRLVLPRPAERIVSLVPSVTESLFTLGAGDRIVGVTRFCVEPGHARDVAQVIGGTKNPDLAAITELQPDLVIANVEENRRADFDALLAAGINVLATYPRRVSAVVHHLELLGMVSDCSAAVAEHRQQLAEVLASGGQVVPPLRVFCPIWKNPWMGFNRNTYAHDALTVAGGANLLAHKADRYCLVELAEIAAADPQMIVLPDEPYIFRPRDLSQMRELAATSAWLHDRIAFIDGKSLLWYGTRTASGIRSLRETLRPLAMR